MSWHYGKKIWPSKFQRHVSFCRTGCNRVGESDIKGQSKRFNSGLSRIKGLLDVLLENKNLSKPLPEYRANSVNRDEGYAVGSI